MNIELINRINQRMSALGMNANSTAAKAGGSPSLVTNILNGRTQNPRIDNLTKIAAALETSVEWLTTGTEKQSDPIAANSSAETQQHNITRHPIVQDIPVLGTAAGSLLIVDDEEGAEGFQMGAEPIMHVGCPPPLNGQKDLYAIFVRGDSMDPMHPPGDIRFASPNRPSKPGDTVIVQTKHWDGDPGQAYIKTYVKRTGETLTLEQINPRVTIQIPIKYVISVHRVFTNNEIHGV